MIEVMLLGPPRVERDGALLAFDTRKAMALLAYLALTDRPRSRDALADLLWPDTSSERARGALRRTLSSLRGAVGAERVEATRDHIRLVKAPGIALDVDRFRDLRDRGELELAADEFRGDLLEGFVIRDAPDFDDWVRAQGEALRRELTATLADLALAQEAVGDGLGAVFTVRRWLSLDPLHEPAHRALIRLLAMTGDRAAALVQYRECVRTLSRELGVPPLVETTELYEAINRGTYPPPAAAAFTGTPAKGALPQGYNPGNVHSTLGRSGAASLSSAKPPVAPFVGRADDLRTLREVYDGIGADGRVVVVEGEAGIGKTRLVEELADALRHDSAHVLVGRAYEDETGLAYAPLVDALRARLRDNDGWLVAAGDRALSEAARLLPEITSDRVTTGVTALSGPGAETRFLAGIWDTLAAGAGGSSPGCLVIDDAQWVDDATRGLLSYGLRRLAGRPLLVVLTWRSPHDRPLRRAASVVARAEGGLVLHLDRLDEAAVVDLVQASQPALGNREVIRRLWERTEGVPLLLVEYLRTLGDGDDWPLPTEARELLRARLDPVSETGRQVLAAAGVLGRSFGVETVRMVSGRSGDETTYALEELVRLGLVRERDLDYDFSHELLRAIVHDETSLARRRLLHGRAAELLGAPAVVARHLQLAGRDEEAAQSFRQAGDEAREVFANADALGHFRAALALGHRDRTEINTAIGDLQTLMGDYAGALLSLQTAAAGATSSELRGVEHRLGRLQHRRGEHGLAEAHLTAALDLTPVEEIADRAGITADLSLVAYSLGDPDRARLLAAEARALAEDADDPHAQCQAYNLLGMLATADGDSEGALGSLAQSRELAEQVGDQDLQVAALNNLALAHRSRRELDRAAELTVAALEVCRATGDRHREAALLNNLADLRHDAGRPDEAMAHLKAAVEIFAEIGGEVRPRPEIWKLVRW